MKHTPLRVYDDDGSIGTVETIEGIPFVQIQPVGPEFSDDLVERNKERQKRAHDVVSAYNATHAAGINPEAIKPMMGSLEAFKNLFYESDMRPEDECREVYSLVSAALTLAKKGVE